MLKTIELAEKVLEKDRDSILNLLLPLANSSLLKKNLGTLEKVLLNTSS